MGPVVALGRGGVSYRRGTPAVWPGARHADEFTLRQIVTPPILSRVKQLVLVQIVKRDLV